VSKRKKIVVVGAGFGGLEAAKRLARFPESDLTLIDRKNHHLFQPLLYQVATAALSPAEIAFPIRTLFSRFQQVDVILGNVQSIDPDAQTLTYDGGTLAYDYLVLACGAKHSYFGKPEWEGVAPGLKTLEQATEIRRRILLAFERAERSSLEQERKDLLTFVIVGGGPTGVELAGAISEISRQTLEKDFHRIDASQARVILIEAASRILPSFPEKLSLRAKRDLEELGVEVWNSSLVTNITKAGVELGERTLNARTVIWAAGVEPSRLGRSFETTLDPKGRVIVRKDLRLPSYENVFVIGDQACFRGDDGLPLPGLAPVAVQQGKHAAKNIIRLIRGQATKDFVYRDHGQMATIGRKRAVVDLKSIQFGGFWAWIVWLFVHIYSLIGFKNRIFVFFQWAWSYVTFSRGARLIVDKEWRMYKDINPSGDDSRPSE